MIANTMRITKSNSDVLAFQYVPTVYGSTTKKDLHLEWFDEKTYFGDDFYARKGWGRPCIYEHMLNSKSNTVMAGMPMEKMILGHAFPVAKADAPDDWQRWFEVEIDRSGVPYSAYVEWMIEKGIMGSSTQALMGSKVVDSDGYISKWFEIENGPTPTPADPKTRDEMMAKALEHGLAVETDSGLILPSAYKAHVKTFYPVVKAENETQAADPFGLLVEPPAGDSDSEETSVADQIEDILNPPAENEEAGEEAAVPVADFEARLSALEDVIGKTLSTVEAMKAAFDVYISFWGNTDNGETPQSLLAELMNMPKTLEQINLSVNDVAKGTVNMAKHLADVKKTDTYLAAQKQSQAERNAEKYEDNKPVPTSATGKKTVPKFLTNAPGAAQYN